MSRCFGDGDSPRVAGQDLSHSPKQRAGGDRPNPRELRVGQILFFTSSSVSHILTFCLFCAFAVYDAGVQALFQGNNSTGVVILLSSAGWLRTNLAENVFNCPESPNFSKFAE